MLKNKEILNMGEIINTDDIKCWQQLGDAIMVMAFKDYYQNAMYKKFLNKELKKAEAVMKECVEFFESEDFELYKGDRYFDDVKMVLDKKVMNDNHFVFQVIANDKKKRVPYLYSTINEKKKIKKIMEENKIPTKLFAVNGLSAERVNAIINMLLEIFIYDRLPDEELEKALKKNISKTIENWRKKYEDKIKQK